MSAAWLSFWIEVLVGWFSIPTTSAVIIQGKKKIPTHFLMYRWVFPSILGSSQLTKPLVCQLCLQLVTFWLPFLNSKMVAVVIMPLHTIF